MAAMTDPRADVLEGLNLFRALEAWGATLYAKWAANEPDPGLRMGHLIIAEREANHARLLAERLRALGSEPGPACVDGVLARQLAELGGITGFVAQLDALKAGPTAEELAAAQAKVDQAQAGLDRLKAGGTQSEVATAQAEVDKAQAALDKLRAGPSAEDVRVAEEALAEARANLDKVKSGATPEEIQEAQAQVDAAQANLDKLRAGPAGTLPVQGA